MNKSVLFLFNLVQDFNILYKLIYLCKDDFNYNVVLIITNEFILRDKDQLLMKEINLIKKDLNIDIFFVNSNIEFFNWLNNLDRCILISASESSVDSVSHKETNEIFNFCPTNITKITIQHGFECVGFLQNNNHNFIHGTNIGFAADIICGWIHKKFQRDLIMPSRSKYVFTGNPAFIRKTSKRNFLFKSRKKFGVKPGIICENTSSARFRHAKSTKMQFINDFLSIAKLLEKKGEKIVLRQHPASRFKKSIFNNPKKLPKNVLIDNSPAHKINWSNFSYGISAPSSVLLDMHLSGIPICIWSDFSGSIDTNLLRSFPIAKSPEEIFSFCKSPKTIPVNLLSEEINSIIKVIKEDQIGPNFLRLFESILY